MLIPAILRKNEILTEFYKLHYTDQLMYETGCCDNWMPKIVEEPNKETFQFAIVNSKDKLIGYVSYYIDWYTSQASRFGVMSFDRGNPLMGKELFGIMKMLIDDLKLHRIEWRMVSGNPVERSYDKLCEKYNGQKIRLRDCTKDRHGNYQDVIIYEIIRKE